MWPSHEERECFELVQSQAISTVKSEARNNYRKAVHKNHNHDWYLIFLHSLRLLLGNCIFRTNVRNFVSYGSVFSRYIVLSPVDSMEFILIVNPIAPKLVCDYCCFNIDEHANRLCTGAGDGN